MMKVFLYLLLLITATNAVKLEANDIFIIIADGFKKEYLNRGLTPNIDKLGASGVKAENLVNVFPTVAYTNNVTLFTGLYPENHGIISNIFRNPISNEYFDSRNPESYNNPKWYDGEFFWEYAEKYGILSNVICVPGGSIQSNHKAPYYFLDRGSKALAKFRIEDAVKRLGYRANLRPRFTAVYFDDIDDMAHKAGTSTDQTNEAIKAIDRYVGEITDSLRNKDRFDSTNIFFISTHGMTDTDKTKAFNIRELLTDKEISIDNNGTYCFVYANTDSVSTKAIANKLSGHEESFVFYTKKDIPDSLHIKNHPYISDILVIAQDGWVITEKNDFQTYGLKGAHGYPPANPEMHGVFIASGPDFIINMETASVNILDIYPLLCKLMKINIPTHIDGKFNNIKHLLK